MRGISIEHPYYEFRFEEEVQRATAARLGVTRTVLDGLDFMPFSPVDPAVGHYAQGKIERYIARSRTS